MKSVTESYQKHAAHFERDLQEPERAAVAETWFDKSTADYWRHERYYRFLDCLQDKNCSWLTIGDGRWGLDAIRIKEYGFTDVTATDISEALLAESKKRGLLEKYAVVNAENIPFQDETVDYVFCKEAFHHFPRPYIALYEMLRAAKHGVFLSEPNDKAMGKLFYRLAKKMQKAAKGKKSAYPDLLEAEYEEVGNYVYTISIREAVKIATALDLPSLLYKGINDSYCKGLEFEPADAKKSKLFAAIKKKIAIKDMLCRLGLFEYDALQIAFLKTPLDRVAEDAFASSGWTHLKLPRNPRRSA